MASAASVVRWVWRLVKIVFRVSKLAVGKVLSRFLLVVNRRLLAFAVITYYFFQTNKAALMSGSPRRILLGLGRSFFEADRTVGVQAALIVQNNLTGVEYVSAVTTLLAALTTLVILFRFGTLLIGRIEPTTGILLRIGVPIVVYGSLAWVVSGGGRVPFTGVWTLIQNIGGVVDVGRVVPGGEAAVNVTGNVTERVAGNVTGG